MMNNEELVVAVNRLLWAISNDSNDYADLSLFRRIQDAALNVEKALHDERWHDFADSVIQFKGETDQ